MQKVHIVQFVFLSHEYTTGLTEEECDELEDIDQEDDANECNPLQDLNNCYEKVLITMYYVIIRRCLKIGMSIIRSFRLMPRVMLQL